MEWQPPPFPDHIAPGIAALVAVTGGRVQVRVIDLEHATFPTEPIEGCPSEISLAAAIAGFLSAEFGALGKPPPAAPPPRQRDTV